MVTKLHTKNVIGWNGRKRQLERPMCRWKDNIKLFLGTGFEDVDLIWFWVGIVASYCEHGNEPPRSTKGRRFLNLLSVTLLAFKENFAAWNYVTMLTPFGTF
jgi:hypothetical protein